MSATNRGAIRVSRDGYQTPGYCIDLILPYIRLGAVQSFLEPCRGDGSIFNRVIGMLNPKAATFYDEITEGRNYLKADYEPRYFDLIMTNPPFSLALEFLKKSLRDGRTVIYLMRINMLGGQLRREFWGLNPPTHLFPLSKRPSFTGRGTDATEYAWFVWDRAQLITSDRWLTVL